MCLLLLPLGGLKAIKEQLILYLYLLYLQLTGKDTGFQCLPFLCPTGVCFPQKAISFVQMQLRADGSLRPGMAKLSKEAAATSGALITSAVPLPIRT